MTKSLRACRSIGNDGIPKTTELIGNREERPGNAESSQNAKMTKISKINYDDMELGNAGKQIVHSKHRTGGKYGISNNTKKYTKRWN